MWVIPPGWVTICDGVNCYIRGEGGGGWGRVGGTTILKLVQSVHAADLEQCSVKCFVTGWSRVYDVHAAI